tara:strand:+ start:15482 stop:15646 length:165 start_codon:yes stop_codon:yes gene_type:complete
MFFSELVISYFSIEDYEILIIQDTEGKLLTIKIDDYGEPKSDTTEYVSDGQVVH